MAMTPHATREALTCFWRRNRETFVPLTSDEWDRYAGISPSVRGQLVKRGLVSASNAKFGRLTVYDITEAGRTMLGDVA